MQIFDYLCGHLRKMSQTIVHTGTVERVENGRAYVRILQASACSSCQAAKLCRSSESKEKVIDIPLSSRQTVSAGQSVQIEGTTSQGLKAVWWAYTLPLILVVVSLFLFVYLTDSETFSAVLSLIVLAFYFAVLYFLRDKFSQILSFKITNITNV